MKLKHMLYALALAGASFSAVANNEVRRADLVADCDGWAIEILTQNTAECPQYNVCYTINVDPVAGGAPVMGCLPSGPPDSLRVRNADGVWAPPLDGVFDVSGTLEIVDLDPACNPVGPLNKTEFNGGVPITLVCDVPEPGIALVKEVSVDGGATYLDANDAASAAVTLVGGDALYRITVSNTGDVPLENVVLNDPILNISNYLVGMLAVGETRILDSGIIPELNAADVCDVPGTVVNVADVSGDPLTGGDPVTDSDPANVRCDQPETGCWFTGGQNIQVNRVRGRPEHSGGGNIYPSCSALPGDGGQWTHTDHDQELHFQARSLTVVECGNVEEIPPGAPSPAVTVNFIRATATGIIKGVGGNTLPESPATAVLVMEDWGEPGRNDKYTILATGAGQVISLDRAALENGGNFQIHQTSCDN